MHIGAMEINNTRRHSFIFREVITEDNEISALLNVFGVKDYLESDKTLLKLLQLLLMKTV